jgi:glycosyltransferase involved in cell wall biosynthesis
MARCEEIDSGLSGVAIGFPGDNMRILLVSDYYPPFIGGAQVQTQLLARKFRERGHDVAVATAWQNDLPVRDEDDGISIYRLRQFRTLPGLAQRRFQHHQPPFPDPVTALLLRRVIREFRPDVVHSYGWISYSAAAALLGKDIPLLITARDYGYSCANRTMLHDGADCSGPDLRKCLGCAGRHYGRPKGWIAAGGVFVSRPLLVRKTSAVHSVSSYVRGIVRRDFISDRIAKGSGQVIHDVIGSVPEMDELSNETAGYPELAQLPAEPFMLFIGALRRVKGIEQLLAAYESLSDPPPLVLIGTMEPDSPKEFPPGVILLRDVSHPAVMAAAASPRCMFGVMPSLLPEPFGTVVCEVMSQGKPVIGTYPGGHTDMIVDHENGLLVPRGDAAALARAMQELISDPEMRGRFGAASRERSRKFTADVSIPRLERLYSQIIEQRSDDTVPVPASF